jgi:hypothetical protein
MTDKKDHNVYMNKVRKTCVSYKGGGSPTPASSYIHKFGPDTLAECEKWIDQNCTDAGGTKCS